MGKSKKYQEAIDGYTNLIKLVEKNKKIKSTLYSNISTSYARLKKYDEAYKYIKMAVSEDEKHGKAYSRKADIERQLNKWVEAEQSLRKAQGLNPALNLQKKIQEYARYNKVNNKKDLYKTLGVDKK